MLNYRKTITKEEVRDLPQIIYEGEIVVIDSLKDIQIAIPGLNALSIGQDKRRFVDEEDLNRNFQT